MVYELFLESIKQMVKERLDESYTIQINSVLKNNSIELDGLVILKKGENISPNIYLNEYYDRYKEGEELNDIVNEILDIYFHAADGEEYGNKILEFKFDEMSEFIFYRVINYSKNKKLLIDIPNIKFLDLAITFHYLIKDDESGIGSIRITREYMNQWGIKVKDLLRIARKNTPILFPASIRSMNEVILDIIQKDMDPFDINNDIPYGSEDHFGDEWDETNLEINKQLVSEMENKNNTKMFILSNTRGINGASVMFYKNVIKDFASKVNSDLYILPSSIHEIILVPYQKHLSIEALTEMVFDVNRTQVSPEEILSDKVYFYDKARNRIE